MNSRQHIDRLFEAEEVSPTGGEGHCTYHAFWRGKKIELKANTSYEAQKKAAAILKVKKSYEVTVVLVGKGDEPVIHSTAEIG